MIEPLLLRVALKQRLFVLVVTLALLGFGIDAMRKLSVDAFPDVTNVQVQIATEASGRSPEEIERFITVSITVAMIFCLLLVLFNSSRYAALILLELPFPAEA